LFYEHDGLKVTRFFVDHGLVKASDGLSRRFLAVIRLCCPATRGIGNLVRLGNGNRLLIHEVIDTEAFIRSEDNCQAGGGEGKSLDITRRRNTGQYFCDRKTEACRCIHT